MGEAAEENDKGKDDTLVEEDAALRGPGDADEEDGKHGPGDESGAAGKMGAREENKRGGAKIGEGGSGPELLVQREILCGRRGLGEACEAEISVVVEEGDGQRGEEKFARAEVQVEIREAEEAEGECRVGLRAPIRRFPVEADFEEHQSEERPAESDGVSGHLVINQRDNQRRGDPRVTGSGDKGKGEFAFGGPARTQVEERGDERDGDEAQRDGWKKVPRSRGVEIDGGDLEQRGDG